VPFYIYWPGPIAALKHNIRTFFSSGIVKSQHADIVLLTLSNVFMTLPGTAPQVPERASVDRDPREWLIALPGMLSSAGNRYGMEGSMQHN